MKFIRLTTMALKPTAVKTVPVPVPTNDGTTKY